MRSLRRVVALEAEKSKLQELLEEQGASRTARSGVELQSLRDDLTRAKRAAAVAQDDAAAAAARADAAEGAAAAKIAGLQRALVASEEVQKALQSELNVRPSADALDALRRELRALQALQFGSVEVGDSDGTGGVGGLDRALAARIRELEHQVTVRTATRHQKRAQCFARCVSASHLPPLDMRCCRSCLAARSVIARLHGTHVHVPQRLARCLCLQRMRAERGCNDATPVPDCKLTGCEVCRCLV
jgi:hypothetical protein